MTDEKARVKERLLHFEERVSGFSLPEWEAFPALPLYMDQVIYLLNGYLCPLPGNEEAWAVTPAMINNYVKLKIIPPPVKKRYGKMHLAYLVMVCVLKQALSTSEIRKVVPMGLEEDGVRALYGGFREVLRGAQEGFFQAVHQAAEPMLAQADEPAAPLIFHAAAASSLYRLLAEEVLSLYPANEKEQ